MTRLLELRLESSGRLDTLRWLEYAFLIGFAATGFFSFSPYGAIFSAPLLLLALMLVPGKQSAIAPEKQRLDILNELQQKGLALRSEWLAVAEGPLTVSGSHERWRIQREGLVWISTCNEKLRRFPELSGIFRAHEEKSDVIDELDDCLAILSRLRRLVNLSESLRLPI